MVSHVPRVGVWTPGPSEPPGRSTCTGVLIAASTMQGCMRQHPGRRWARSAGQITVGVCVGGQEKARRKSSNLGHVCLSCAPQGKTRAVRLSSEKGQVGRGAAFWWGLWWAGPGPVLGAGGPTRWGDPRLCP